MLMMALMLMMMALPYRCFGLNESLKCGYFAACLLGLQVWVMTLRAMDDIKETVRQAALSLAKTLRSVSLRLVDAGVSGPAVASAAVGALLPVLLEQGLASSVGEVQVGHHYQDHHHHHHHQHRSMPSYLGMHCDCL